MLQCVFANENVYFKCWHHKPRVKQWITDTKPKRQDHRPKLQIAQKRESNDSDNISHLHHSYIKIPNLEISFDFLEIKSWAKEISLSKRLNVYHYRGMKREKKEEPDNQNYDYYELFDEEKWDEEWDDILP